MKGKAKSKTFMSQLSVDTTEQSTDFRDSDSTEMTTTARPDAKRTLYFVGFVEKRLHNQSLTAIIGDLLPSYYCSANPTLTQPWAPERVRNQLAAAKACVFMMNEFTLKDSRCLLCIQHAWDLLVPLVVLRHPRMKLIISPIDSSHSVHATMNAKATTANWKQKANQPAAAANGPLINYELLQDVLFVGYRQSVVYERTRHEEGVKALKERLKKVLAEGLTGRPTSLASGAIVLSSRLSTVPSEATHLPPILPAQLPKHGNFGVGLSLQPVRRSIGDGSSITGDPTAKPPNRSRSMVNLLLQPTADPPVDSSGTATPRKRKRFRQHRAKAAALLPKDIEVSSASTGDQNGPAVVNTIDDLLTPETSMNFSGRHSTTRTSISALDDEMLYQQTQYLVFSVRNRTKKPTLISFPSDILKNDGDETGRPESTYGSDSDLEEEMEIADNIQGNLEIASRTGSPAPYLGDL